MGDVNLIMTDLGNTIYAQDLSVLGAKAICQIMLYDVNILKVPRKLNDNDTPIPVSGWVTDIAKLKRCPSYFGMVEDDCPQNCVALSGLSGEVIHENLNVTAMYQPLADFEVRSILFLRSDGGIIAGIAKDTPVLEFSSDCYYKLTCNLGSSGCARRPLFNQTVYMSRAVAQKICGIEFTTSVYNAESGKFLNIAGHEDERVAFDGNQLTVTDLGRAITVSLNGNLIAFGPVSVCADNIHCTGSEILFIRYESIPN